jgi:hypothetical protein
MRRVVRAASAVALLVLAGCESMSAERADDPPPVERIALFPLNVVPDVVVDAGSLVLLPVWMFGADEPAGGWPSYWLGSPLIGPLWGLSDAGHGRPFWRTMGPEMVERLRGDPGTPPPRTREGP